MNINEKTFCVVPFAQLNTRGKGDPRICCSIAGIEYGIPKHLTVDQINDETYTPQTEVFNLAEDSIDDLWNSPFMKDFRMRQMNGERLELRLLLQERGQRPDLEAADQEQALS
jgi:hypothetical protein